MVVNCKQKTNQSGLQDSFYLLSPWKEVHLWPGIWVCLKVGDPQNGGAFLALREILLGIRQLLGYIPTQTWKCPEEVGGQIPVKSSLLRDLEGYMHQRQTLCLNVLNLKLWSSFQSVEVSTQREAR